jgi:hypothetical protein
MTKRKKKNLIWLLSFIVFTTGLSLNLLNGMLNIPDVFQSSRPFAEPLKLYSENGELNFTMSVDAVRIKNDLFDYTTRAYCYHDPTTGIRNCTVPGPTWYVKPGDTVRYSKEYLFLHHLKQTSHRMISLPMY